MTDQLFIESLNRKYNDELLKLRVKNEELRKKMLELNNENTKLKFKNKIFKTLYDYRVTGPAVISISVIAISFILLAITVPKT